MAAPPQHGVRADPGRRGGRARQDRRDPPGRLTAIPEGFVLEPLTHEHLDEVFALHADPRVWTHLPSGRHSRPQQSAAVIDRAEASRASTGLGHWAVRERASGRLVGVAGVHRTELDVWNLSYRFHPDVQGRGLARAVAQEAIDAAHDVRPGLPVIARMHDSNPSSSGLAERLGLALVWHGDATTADGAAVARRIYADRPLEPRVLDGLIALG